MHLIDLTYPLDEAIPTWTGSCGFSHEIKMDYDRGARVLQYKCHAGAGTHIDAPSHFIRGGANVADIPLRDLIAPACVIDVSDRCAPTLLITRDDIVHFEKEHGTVPKGAVVFGNTGWAQFWNEPAKYRNDLKIPGFHFEAAQLLMERGIGGLGIDTLSPEMEDGFPIHKLILGAGKYIVENVANLHLLPPVGATVWLLPLKVRCGAEAPVRAMATF